MTRFGISHFKAEPLEYVRIKDSGRTRKEGQGISAWYLPYRTTIEAVSMAAGDAPFTMKLLSQDNQEITVNGGVLYRVTEPKRVLDRFNHSLNLDCRERTYQDPEQAGQLEEHLRQFTALKARSITERMTMETLIAQSDDVATRMSEALRSLEDLGRLGITLDMVYVMTILPKPEIAKALEAPYREILLQSQDTAIKGRQRKSIEQQKALDKASLDNAIELERQRLDLIRKKGENDRAAAEYARKATEEELKAFEGQLPEKLLSSGFYLIGRRAERIEHLTVTPDLLSALSNRR